MNQGFDNPAIADALMESGPRPSKTDKLYNEALSGDPESQVRLGCNYRESGDSDEAEKWFFKALEQGYNPAHFHIGFLKHEESMKTNNDPELAWERSSPLYKQSAHVCCKH